MSFPNGDMSSPYSDSEDGNGFQKRWYHYSGLVLTMFFLLMPHPSLLLSLVEFYLRAAFHPIRFTLYLFIPLLLTFAAISSLIVCVARHPGSPPQLDDSDPHPLDVSFHPKHWCRTCHAPKPDRAHHCSTCNTCILKMDHHCPWLAHKCIVSYSFTSCLFPLNPPISLYRATAPTLPSSTSSLPPPSLPHTARAYQCACSISSSITLTTSYVLIFLVLLSSSDILFTGRQCNVPCPLPRLWRCNIRSNHRFLPRISHL